jgi:dihydrodipicolinate synthase/N-acetylneuraminate lyase
MQPGVADRGTRFSGVYVATAAPFDEDGGLLADRFADHCGWLVANGVRGVVPNGSLGEYETMTDEERAVIVAAAVEAVGTRADVIPGVSGRSAREARRWAEQAAEAGCTAVMCLPPTSHAPTPDEVVAHYQEVARVGLPVIVYNNPFSTRVDLTPEMLARLAEIDEVVAVKEFSQDVRRVPRIQEGAPRIEVICGCDDTLLESLLFGVRGWIAGFANAFPAESVRLCGLGVQGKWDEAVGLYRRLLPLLRWDADPRFVQAVKLALDEVGRYGGPVRLPRRPLPDETAAAVRRACRTVRERG